jgi:5-methylthioadenosine/S-adenosylhomocysteine deaminase
MLRAGVSMALGTDSRGSNPDLDMLTEMRFAAAQNPDVNPATILELGTLGGARALGWADRAGTLEAGKSADLAVVQITSEKAGDPHELIFALSTRVAQTWARGRVLYDAAK